MLKLFKNINKDIEKKLKILFKIDIFYESTDFWSNLIISLNVLVIIQNKNINRIKSTLGVIINNNNKT